MRRLILAGASALALGIAGVGPVLAADPTAAAPTPAAPTATPTPSTDTMQPATPQTGATTQHPQAGATSSMSGNGQADNSNAAGTSPTGTMSTADIQQVQQKLQEQGLYHGKIDGLVGPGTQHALRAYQRKTGLPETAALDQQTMSSLLGTGAGVGSSTPPGSSSDMTTSPGSSSGTAAPPPSGDGSAGTNGSANPSSSYQK